MLLRSESSCVDTIGSPTLAHESRACPFTGAPQLPSYIRSTAAETDPAPKDSSSLLFSVGHGMKHKARVLRVVMNAKL